MTPIDQRMLNLVTLKPSQYGKLGLFCHDLPGVGGRLKAAPEDFEVEEIPAYEPGGEGEHLFLWVEKRDLTSDQLVQSIAGSLGIPVRDIGIAGKKDKIAVTRQFISVPVKATDRIERIKNKRIRVLSSTPHTNKLSTGHNRGNRFRVVIRDLTLPERAVVERIVDRIKALGIPNFYGIQRFGAEGDTAEIGFKILNGEDESLLKQWRVKSRKKFAISAAQAFLFNRYLMRRILEKGIGQLLAGDVVFKTTGGIFRVEDLEAEQKRFEAGEIVPAGPIYGHKMFAAADASLAFEDQVLIEAGMDRNRFSDFGKIMPGSRRAIFVHPTDLSWELQDSDLHLTFALPSGSYATVLLAAFMKPQRM